MWTDVTARPNGNLVIINGDGQRVTFAAGDSVACVGVHLRAAALDQTVAVIGQALAGDSFLAVSDRGASWSHPSKVHGVQACAIRQVGGDHFSAAWVSDGGRLLRTVDLDANLREIAQAVTDVPHSVFGTSQGLLDWHPLVWTDTARILTIRDVRYTLWMTRDPWTVGQGQDVGGVIAYDSRTQTHWRVSGVDTQLPPRIAVRSDGSALVAITYGAGVFVESEDFTPLETAALPVPARTRLLWRGADSWSHQTQSWIDLPGNVAWGQPANSRPTVEDAESAHQLPDGAHVWAIYFGDEGGTHLDRTRTDELVKVKREARRLLAPVLVYCDDLHYREESRRVGRTLKADGYRVLCGVQAYPHELGHPDRTIARVLAECMTLQAAGEQVVLVWAAFGASAWATADVEALAVSLERDVISQVPAIVGALCFGANRANKIPRVVDFYSRVCAAMPSGLPPSLAPQPIPSIQAPQPAPTIPPVHEDEDTMPLIEDAVFQKTVETVTDKLKDHVTIPPSDGTWEKFRPHLRNSVSVAGGRMRAQGVNASHSDMFFQTLAVRGEKPIDTLVADDIVKWSIEQDKLVSLRRN